jgi:hypothetical protein
VGNPDLECFLTGRVGNSDIEKSMLLEGHASSMLALDTHLGALILRCSTRL